MSKYLPLLTHGNMQKIHPSLGLDYKSAKTAALKEERGTKYKRYNSSTTFLADFSPMPTL